MTPLSKKAIVSVAMAAVFMVASCAGGPPPKRPIPVERIESINSMGAQAYARGEYEGAYDFYLRALNEAISIEKVDSIAINAINAAAALRAQGKYKEAGELLDIVLGNGAVKFEPAHKSVAAYLSAAIALEQGRAEDSIGKANESIDYCRSGGCDAPEGVNIVLAAASLDLTDANAAIRHAQRVGGKAPKREQANAKRIMAEASIKLSEPQTALRLFDEALEIDKAEALSGRIAKDLMGAGRALMMLGDDAGASGRFERAVAVSRALGDSLLEAEAMEALDLLRNPEK